MRNEANKVIHNLFCNYLEHLGVVERYMQIHFKVDISNCSKKEWDKSKKIYKNEIDSFKQNYEKSNSFDELDEKWKNIILELEKEKGLDGKDRSLSIL